MSLEKYLVLNRYFLSLFGAKEFKDFQERLRDVPNSFDRDGRSYLVNALLSYFNGLKISEDRLLEYDRNIQSYVRKISYRRDQISLKYFQYLAVLFTEIILDNLKNSKKEFLNELNSFLKNYKEEQDIEIIDPFTENDLKKLAFWMATGSGKTLIMHINYYQFLEYNLFQPDNIILITPNEGLSKQHSEELQKSGIPCQVYTGNLNSRFKIENEVLVIEMTKLVEEKKGEGVSIPIDTFEGKNLIFVDEGHKGRRSEDQKWAKLRDRIARDGFTFEYSATFGQILSERQPEILKEYAKSIIFDYSYKYFYLDGYGKDFSVLNVKNTREVTDFSKIMFVANLLSFYEQLMVYEENQYLAKDYNIEKPLWIFVGTTVVGGKNGSKGSLTDEEKKTLSDVIQIIDFIKTVIQDEEWFKKKIEDILLGNTGIKDENGRDVFQNRFEYIKNRTLDLDDIYKRVFGGKGVFSVYELENAEGEFGLEVGENEYFGVVNIGDVSNFKKLLEERGIIVGKDAISDSLFDNIKKEDSKINILIGSKKFIEGWDTWRVSSMGLLNIGKNQGSQIIQLFGRGVRLKGKGMSLKRSGDNSAVKLLETLNIYGIKADYLTRFLEAISKEEVEFETIKIPVKPNHEEKWEELYILSRDSDRRFEDEVVLMLELDDKICFTIDLMPKVSMYLSRERKEGVSIEDIAIQPKILRLTDDVIEVLNWNRIWEEIIQFKVLRGYWNLVIKRETLKHLLLSEAYKILTPGDILEIKVRDDIERLEDIAILIIKKYIDLFYKKYAKQFETRNMHYDKVNRQRPLFVFERDNDEHSYILQISKNKKKLINEIKKLAKDFNELIKEDMETLPRVYFDRHLYVPILLQSKEIDKITPVGLVESEKEFIIGLREYINNNRGGFSDIEIFLLRNYPKSGVGFFNLSGFYPDFIMWIKKGQKQIIAFIDPKGLEHTKGLDDEKIELRKDIKELERSLGNQDIVLESIIISKTPYSELIRGRTLPPSKDEYKNHNVLFLEDKWQEELFKILAL